MDACLTKDEWKEFLEKSPFDSIDSHLSSHLETCPTCNQTLERLCESDDLRVLSECQQSPEVKANGRDWEFVRTRLIEAGKLREDDYEFQEPEFLEEPVRESLGRFRLIKKLGEGAHGVVYLATDTVIGRTVALKLPRHHALTNENRRDSFLGEAQAAGALQHPNIVSVYEAGEIDGVCFMAAAYTSGVTLEEWFNDQSHPVPFETIARIIAVLADAVQHAHLSNIIHRDLKPTNILIDFDTPSGNLPFRPQITDFGLAKIINLEEQQQTATGVIKGTVAYMSPEQVQQQAVGAHTDLFALGVMLYQMLTGQLPFQGENLSDTLRKIVDESPVSPRRIVPSIPRDLQAICLKCLEKRPQDRYAKASELHDDLIRFCNGEAIAARPTSSIVLAWRWAKRRPSAAAMLLTIVLALWFGVLGLGFHVRQLGKVNASLLTVTEDLENALDDASKAQDRAEESEKAAKEFALQARRMSYASDMQLAARSWRDGEIRQARTLLDRHIGSEKLTDLRGLEWYYLDRMISVPSRTAMTLDSAIYWIAQSPTKNEIAVSTADGSIRFVNCETMAVEGVIDSGQVEVNCVVYSPDGKQLVSAGDDGTIKVFDLSTRKPIKVLEAHERQVFGLAFTPDGKSMVSCGADSQVIRWNTETWQQEATFEKHVGRVEAIAISPNGKWLATAGADHYVRLWDLETNQYMFQIRPGPPEQILSVSFSHDNRMLAIGSRSGRIIVRGTTDWDLQTVLLTPDPVQRLEFAPDSSHLISADPVGVVRLWKIKLNPESDEFKPASLKSWAGHRDRIFASSIEKGQSRLWTGGEDGELKVSELVAVQSHRLISADGRDINHMRPIGANQGIVACIDGVYRVNLNEPDVWEPIETKKGDWLRVAVSRDGNQFAASSDQGELRVWNTADESVRVIPYKEWNFGFVRTFSPDGRFLVYTECPDSKSPGRLHLLDVSSGESLWSHEDSGPGNEACFTPDGRFLIYASGARVYARDLVEGVNIGFDDVHSQVVRWLDVTPDGQHLVTTSEDGTIVLWTTSDFRQVHTFNTHALAIRGGLFSPNGRTLATIDAKGVLKMFQIEATQELLELDLRKDDVGGLGISGDGDALVTFCRGRDRIFVLPVRWP